MADDDPFGERLISTTETYLDRIADCVTLLPTLLERYRSGADYRSIADRIQDVETECDRRNRRISSLVTNVTAEEIGLSNARIHLNSPQLVELYQTMDDIPNTAEQIAEELVTIGPACTDACFRGLSAMAEHATTAMAALVTAVTRFVRVLCTPSESGTIAEEIETIRDIESTCDSIRNEVVATAFESESVTQPLVHREFAHLFDELMDVMEDVVDQIVLVSSTEAWITTESESDRTRRPTM